MARRESARRLRPGDVRVDRSGRSIPHQVRLAEEAPRRGLGGHPLAAGVRRPRRDDHGADHLSAGVGARAGTRLRQPAGHLAGRPDADALGHGRAERAVHPQHPERGRSVVPGLFRAGFGIGPRLAANARGGRRGYVRRERPESLDQFRAQGRLLHPAGADRPGRAQAQGHFLPAGRYARARRDGPAAGPDFGRRGIQRGLLRGRARAQGAHGGRTQWRLAGRHYYADVRAGQLRHGL